MKKFSYLFTGVILVAIIPLFYLLTSPMLIDPLDKAFFLLGSCYFWATVAVFLTRLTYEHFLKQTDELVTLNPQKLGLFLSVFLAVFHNFYLIYSIHNGHMPLAGNQIVMAFPLLIFTQNRLSIGNRYLLYGFKIIDLTLVTDFQISYAKGKGTLFLYFENNKRYEANLPEEIAIKLEDRLEKILRG